MDVAYINPFITSSRQVFDLMVHVPLSLGKPHLRAQGTPHYAVSAVIGLGGAVTGCVVLGFSQQVALALASGLVGNPLPALDADAVDALGEIVNMIAGAAKKQLPGGLTTLSTPNVILGSHQVRYPASLPIIVIPCQTPAGSFAIEVALEQSPDPTAACASAPTAADTPATANAALVNNC